MCIQWIVKKDGHALGLRLPEHEYVISTEGKRDYDIHPTSRTSKVIDALVCEHEAMSSLLEAADAELTMYKQSKILNFCIKVFKIGQN